MGYALSPNLSFCVTGGHAVFLDLTRDRYFRLSARSDAAFQTLLGAGQGPEHDTETLIRLGLIQRSIGDSDLAPVRVLAASRSLLEMEPLRQAWTPWTTLQVGWSVAKVRRLLMSKPIATVLEDARATAANGLAESRKTGAEASPNAISRASAAYNDVRRFIPIDTVCLLDSLALVDFLARRGLFARLVMGVKLNPFAAHCWVQHQDVVLNDALDRAGAYTPILAVG